LARYTGPVCRICRREGLKLFLKGGRCYTKKCAIEKRNFPPGQHGRRPGKQSEYGVQLREKQKARRIHFVLERPFRNYYVEATRRRGITGDNLLQLLETRLDSATYRVGFATSRREARQLVGHGHVAVNGRRVNVPSYQLREGDVMSLTPSGEKMARVEEALGSRVAEIPAWLEVDDKKKTARVLRFPQRDDIDLPVQEQLIVELYSK